MTTILFGLSALHRLTQTMILKAALNFILQLSIVRLCLFWPMFYNSLFRFEPHRRFIWDIITNPLPPIKAKAKRPSLKIVCLNENLCCFSFYQTRGDYAYLNKKIEKDLDEAVADATVAVFHDDPLRLAIPYVYILERLPERIIMKNGDGCVCNRFVKILFYSLVEVSVGSSSLIEIEAAAIFV